MDAPGTDVHLSAREGALSAFEIGYRLNHNKADTGLEGVYKLGALYHTGEFVDMQDGAAWAFANASGGAFPLPPVRNHSGNYSGYLVGEQQLFYELDRSDPAKQGLLAFCRVLGAPPERNLTELELDGGLLYRGLIPHRDWDTLAIAGSYLEISDDLRHAQRAINTAFPGAVVISDHESFIELNYKIQATAWWTIQASYQHVFHPGGSAAIPDANVVIVQTTFRL